MKSIVLISVMLSASAALQAQTAAGSTNVSGSAENLPAAFKKRQDALINSQVHFAAHDYATAESVLESGNASPENSPQWHVETGFLLAQTAFNFKSQSDAVTASAVAKLALAHLMVAEKNYDLLATPAEVANTKELIGYIQEFLLGDRSTAKAYYQAAATLSPKTGRAAELLSAVRRSESGEIGKR